MSALSEIISNSKFVNRPINERQLGELVGSTNARRYALVNRALKDGSIIRIKRGLYFLTPKSANDMIHPFVVAQALVHGSYISFETALAFHGWIPEAVLITSSVTPERKTQTYGNEKLGHFSFHPLAINEYQFMKSVERIKIGDLTAFVAKPLRALMDLVALRKENWSGLDWITKGMRIDQTQLKSLKPSDFSALRGVYKHKAAVSFFDALETSVKRLRAPASEDSND